MNRQDHLEWCKKRALEYIDAGDLPNAVASMLSDLKKHPDTTTHLGIELGVGLLMMGKLSTGDEVRKYIQGFN